MGFEILFIVSVAIIGYAYFGYPILVYLLSHLFAQRVQRRNITPRVSIIIAAHNEENGLDEKLNNVLALNYPKDRLEIIVASDCSTDRTDEIAQSYAGQGVILCRQSERLGKTMAQRNAVRFSTGDILVFSDATTLYEPETLRHIVRNFADTKVGCVTGQLIYVDRSATAVGEGCRSYWNYEKLIKTAESRLGSLIGVSGCLFAIRRNCFAQIAGNMIEDFAIASEVYLQGLRTVYEPEAVVTEDTNNRVRDEFRMRVRVISQTLDVLNRYRIILNPFRQGLFAWQMLSHKVLRYAVPWFLLTALFSSLMLQDTSGYWRFIVMAQLAFYLLAALAWLGDRLHIRLGPLGLPVFFVLVNTASVIALLKFISGHSQTVWEPRRDPKTPHLRVADK